MTVASQATNSGVASTVMTRVSTRDTEQGAVMDTQTLSEVSVCCLFTIRYDLCLVFGTSFLLCHTRWH
jgi:hypothetical protein